MLFIPIDVLNMKPKFHQTSGLNHVAWFILHCLVFREQSLVLSNRAAHLSDLFIISRWVFSVKNFFKFFLTEFGTDMFQSLANQGFAGSYRVPYLSATCIMIHVFSSYVNTFFKKSKKRGCWRQPPRFYSYSSLPFDLIFLPRSSKNDLLIRPKMPCCPWRELSRSLSSSLAMTRLPVLASNTSKRTRTVEV